MGQMFNHLTEWKQMTNFKLLVLHKYTWNQLILFNHLTVGKQMNDV